MGYPKIDIIFCTRCKWNLRSAWYAQELIQTFDDKIGEVALVPGETGEFKVAVYKTKQAYIDGKYILVWDRKVDGGFPDGKYLKQRVKKLVFHDEVSVGAHIDRDAANETLITKSCVVVNTKSTECTECQ